MRQVRIACLDRIERQGRVGGAMGGGMEPEEVEDGEDTVSGDYKDCLWFLDALQWYVRVCVDVCECVCVCVCSECVCA